MRDRRSVDDLSIEELERILAIKKRQAREGRMRRYTQSGRRVDMPLPDRKRPEVPEFPVEEMFEVEGMRESKALRNRALLFIEVGAVVGLIALLIAVAFSLRDLNQESAEALELGALPTASVTPLFNTVVLPSGHTPPTSPGGAQPNYAEVPQHLRPLVEESFFAPVTVPTPGPVNPTRITIPALGVDAPVVEGTGWEQLKRGVGRQPGTGLPGQTGNLVLSAHNDIFGQIFRDLDQLVAGDEIIVHTATRTFTYVVRETLVVEPTEVEVMNPTHEPTTTLISCYPYLVDTQRIVIVSDLLD